MPRRKSPAPRRKNSLVANINRRKRKGISRPKSRSTVSKKAYRDMRQGWGRGKTSTARKEQQRTADSIALAILLDVAEMAHGTPYKKNEN